MQAQTLTTWVARRISVRTRLQHACVSYLLFLMVVSQKHSFTQAARFSGLNKSVFCKLLRDHFHIAIYTLARIIHAPLSSRWSPPKMRRHVCYQAPDERCSSLNRSGVIRFHVSALCQVLSRAASRRTGILVRHDHHGSNEVEPTWRRAIKAIGTVPCLIDSPAP